MHTHETGASAGAIAFMLGIPTFHTSTEWKRGVRAQAEQQVESLIALLDAMDADPDLEDGGDREFDVADDRHDEIDEDGREDDDPAEDDGTREPSLAHPENHPWFHREHFTNFIMYCEGGDQSDVSLGRSDDREGEHDGREPDESGYADQDALWLEDGREPSLGATEAIDQSKAWDAREGWFAEDGEPDLGWTGHGTGLSGDVDSARDDREQDLDFEPSEAEPNLASPENHESQSQWARGDSFDCEDGAQ